MCDSSSPTTLCDTASVIIVMQPLAGVGFQYRIVTIDCDILGKVIAATVQTDCGGSKDGQRAAGRDQLDRTVGRAERTRGIARLCCIELRLCDQFHVI
jgi:hypothetical protein